MKLNDKALEAAAQVAWKDSGHQGHFREEAVNPDYWPCHASRIVLAYLDALDAEGLADLHEYWSERVEKPPRSEVRKGDMCAYRAAAGRWQVQAAESPALPVFDDFRVLRRAPRPRQWKIGDLVDETRDLPDGAVMRDEGGFIAEYIAAHDMADMFHIAGSAGAHNLDTLNNPRIIWLPENEDES